MLSRQQMLAILSTTSDDSLMQAMSAIGVPQDDSSPSDQMNQPESSGLESWNAKQVSVPPANKPVFFDKSKFQQAPAQPAPQYSTLDSLSGGNDDLGGMAAPPVDGAEYT